MNNLKAIEEAQTEDEAFLAYWNITRAARDAKNAIVQPAILAYEAINQPALEAYKARCRKIRQARKRAAKAVTPPECDERASTGL